MMHTNQWAAQGWPDLPEDEALDDTRDERTELLADLRALRELWRLPMIDGVPVQPTREEMPDALRWWAAAGVVAMTGTTKYGPLVAIIERHLYERMESVRARLLELDAAAQVAPVMRAMDALLKGAA